MSGFPVEEIVTERLRLRLTRLSDAEDVARACSDPTTREFLTMMPSPYTVDDAIAWIDNRASKAFAEGRAQWIIADKDTDRLLGSLGFPMVLHGRGQAEIGYWVAPWARGKGVATEAVVAATDWAFANGIHRMTLVADLANFGSQKVALAAGFQREATLRGEHRQPDGARRDGAAFARLSDDEPGRTPRLLPDLPSGELTDGVVTLRPLTKDDADDAHAISSLPDVARGGAVPRIPTYEQTLTYVSTAYAQWLAGDAARMSIRDAETDAFAGEVGMYYRGPKMRTAMFGIHLSPDWRGRGFATRAIRLATNWAFDAVGVQRLEGGTAVWNEASQAIMRRAGWTREGVQRSYFPDSDGGGRVDNILWSLLPGEGK